MSHQKGSILFYGLAALAVVTVAGGVVYTYNSAIKRAERAEAALEKEKTAFATFREETARLGRLAQKKADLERKRQAEVSQRTVQSYEKRLAAVNDTYSRLREQRISAGSSPVPALPAATISTATTADSDRLLSVLEAADRQTQQLIELQAWVRAQAAQ